MAKTMFIVRHGKARTKESGEKDQDRLLDAEGMRQSSRMGAYLYNKNTDISAIICSHASRAQQTAEQISDQISFDLSKIIIDEDLYEASVRIIMEKVKDFSNEWSEVLIVGHNPVLSYFVEYLTGHHFNGMEPASVVKIACNIDDWKEVDQANSSYEYYASPEDY